MRIDQDGSDSGATEHGGRRRAGKTAADDRNVSVSHGEIPASNPILAAGIANKGLVCRLALCGNPGSSGFWIIYPDKTSDSSPPEAGELNRNLRGAEFARSLERASG